NFYQLRGGYVPAIVTGRCGCGKGPGDAGYARSAKREKGLAYDSDTVGRSGHAHVCWCVHVKVGLRRDNYRVLAIVAQEPRRYRGIRVLFCVVVSNRILGTGTVRKGDKLREGRVQIIVVVDPARRVSPIDDPRCGV